MSEKVRKSSDKTFQEGTTPVQAFTVPAILPTETEPRQRLGRPCRVSDVKGSQADAENGADDSQGKSST